MGSKLLLTFNIKPQQQDGYMRFMVNDFIPNLQSIGLKNVGVWHTAYGNYPVRLLVFVTESTNGMDRALSDDVFQEMESKLGKYVSEYSRRVVPFDARFQF